MGVIRKPEYGETQAEYDSVLNHFNWGAFFFDWLWGLANGCLGKMKLVFVIYILLCIPFVNIFALLGYIVLKIYYGLKGNKWAYEGRAFYSPQDFEDTQKRWAIAGTAVYLPGIIALLAILIITILLASVTMAIYSNFSGKSASTSASYNTTVTKTLAQEIIDAENLNWTFNTGEEAADYLLDNSSYLKTQKIIYKAEKYDKNSIQLYRESSPDIILYVYVINKTANCDLQAKNCSVTLYPYHKRGEKVTASEKVYFDSQGKIKQVTLKK